MGDWLQDKCNEIQKAQQEHIQKSFGSDLEKSGEGSRGGKVIGHTKSGKPIYAVSESQKIASGAVHRDYVNSTRDFSEQDHKDAYLAHMKIADKKRKENKHHRSESAAEHHLSQFKEQLSYHKEDPSKHSKKQEKHRSKRDQIGDELNKKFSEHLRSGGSHENFKEDHASQEKWQYHAKKASEHEKKKNEIEEGNRQRKHEAAKKYAES